MLAVDGWSGGGALVLAISTDSPLLGLFLTAYHRISIADQVIGLAHSKFTTSSLKATATSLKSWIFANLRDRACASHATDTSHKPDLNFDQ